MITLRDVTNAIDARLGELHHAFGVAAKWGSNNLRPVAVAKVEASLGAHVQVMITPPDGHIVTMVVAESVPDLAGEILRHATYRCGTVAPLAVVVECVERTFGK
jgi:hypothetical protein